MKVLILNKKQATVALSLVMVVVLGMLFSGDFLIRAAAQQNRLLPIYSVEVQNQEQKISLGINCAWGNEDIPQILDDLDELEVKATFFVVGDWVKKYPETVKEIFERGHEIGNHSTTHADMTKLNENDIKKEIEECSSWVEEITGEKPNLFRAPSGAYNNLVVKTATELGYYSIQWDCDSLDWKGYTTQQMLEKIMKDLNYGSIMLFHNDTDYTKEALPEIITQLKTDGYEFVKVGELIYKDGYEIDNAGRQIKN